MYESEKQWRAADRYFAGALVDTDAALTGAVERAADAGLPNHEVAPNQGKLLHLLARMMGARRVLEFGTLAGYSTIWLARAVGPGGHVTTLEIDEDYAELARENLAVAGLLDRVDVLAGPALDHAQQLIEARTDPFDLVAADRRLDATALQTVGLKGWDGFVLALVTDGS